MKLVLACVGKLKSGPERALCERYGERLIATMKSCGFAGLRIAEFSESPARRAEERRGEEARALAGLVEPGSRLIVFDERGTGLDSPGFARRLAGWREAGAASSVLIIGGADGVDESLRMRADLVLSFGAMTLPHQLVRALVLEQLYRATTILTGHPYHRG